MEDVVPNLPIHLQPILQRLLESRACMLMIARCGLYLFHLICAPGGHGSCNDRGQKRAYEKREGEREKERERGRPLALRSDEIFALSLCREILRIARLRVCARSDGRKQRGRR